MWVVQLGLSQAEMPIFDDAAAVCMILLFCVVGNTDYPSEMLLNLRLLSSGP